VARRSGEVPLLWHVQRSLYGNDSPVFPGFGRAVASEIFQFEYLTMTSVDVLPSETPQDLAKKETGDEHKLENTWCLWVLMHGAPGQRPVKNHKDQWQNSNACAHTFSTVEDFWCLYNNIHGPAQQFHGDLSFFKQGIQPAWEDATCAKGGRWLVKLEEKTSGGKSESGTKMKQEQVEETWLNLTLALIGEGFGGNDNDEVCGAVLSSRAKGSSKLALWVKTTEPKVVLRLGETYRQILHMTMPAGDIGFEDFSEKAYTKHLTIASTE